MPESNNNSGGTDYGAWIDRFLGWYDWYDRKKDADKPPEFHQVPMSPEQRKLYEMYMKNLSYDSPTRQAIYPFLTDQINRFSGGQWQSPGTITDFGDLKQGYSAYQRAGVTGSGGGFPALGRPEVKGAGQSFRGSAPSTGFDGRIPFNMQSDIQSAADDPDAPQWGETIADWLLRNPGGNPGDYLPGGGGGSGATNPWERGMEYGSLPPQLVSWATEQLKAHGWDIAATIAGIAAGPMGAMGVEAVKTVYNHLKGGGSGSGSSGGSQGSDDTWGQSPYGGNP